MKDSYFKQELEQFQDRLSENVLAFDGCVVTL